MKLTHTLAIVALSTSLGACIIAPPRPPFVQVTAPTVTAYVDPTPAIQVLPYVGLGWWAGAQWSNHHHNHRHSY
jgi:hypothetical protein